MKKYIKYEFGIAQRAYYVGLKWSDIPHTRQTEPKMTPLEEMKIKVIQIFLHFLSFFGRNFLALSKRALICHKTSQTLMTNLWNRYAEFFFRKMYTIGIRIQFIKSPVLSEFVIHNGLQVCSFYWEKIYWIISSLSSKIGSKIGLLFSQKKKEADAPYTHIHCSLCTHIQIFELEKSNLPLNK